MNDDVLEAGPLAPLAPIRHAPGETLPKQRLRWGLVGIFALVIALLTATGVGATHYYLAEQEKAEQARLEQERADQAATDASAYASAQQAYRDALAANETAVADLNAYADRLQFTANEVDAYPKPFSVAERKQFTTAVGAYLLFADFATSDELPVMSTEDLENAYRSGGVVYERAADQIGSHTTELADQTAQLKRTTTQIENLRLKVDDSLVALAAAATEKAPVFAEQHAKASADALSALESARAELDTVARGTFKVTPNRMPTAVLYGYVQAARNADASHQNVVAAEEAARIAAEEEAARLRAAEAQAEAEREAARLAAAEQQRSAQPSASGSSGSQQSSGSSQQSAPPASAPSSATYSIGDLEFHGVIRWNGFKFTYYSESVLPGGGLNIPGRHVNAGGFVSDGDGYIVLAANRNIPKGTVYGTPFGYDGKVYDTCPECDASWLDVYTR